MIGTAPSFWGTKYFEEYPKFRLTSDAPEAMKKEFEEFFADWDLGQSKHKEMEKPTYIWTGEIVDRGRTDAIEAFRKRRQDRLDAREVQWITVRGNHIPVDEDGNPIGGQEKVFGDRPTKKRANDDIAEINDGGGDFEEKSEKVKEILSNLPKGSKISFPDSWDNDDGSKTSAIWNGESWVANGGWSRPNGWSCSMEEMAGYFVNEDPEERPKISSVAQSEETKERRAIERERKKDKFYQEPNGGKPQNYRSISESEYKARWNKAQDLFDDEVAEIDKSYNKKIKDIDDKYGSIGEKRWEIKRSNLSDKEKEEKLEELSAEAKKRSEERDEAERERCEAYQEAEKKWKSNYDLDYEFKAKDRDYSMREDAMAVNPNYILMDPQYHENCVPCSLAWELRCRGYDVEADGKNGTYGAISQFRSIFRDCESLDVSGGHEGTMQIIEKMKEWGDGARAIINTTHSNGSGHAYNVMNRGGNIIFVDSQGGGLWDSEDGGNIERAMYANLMRVDQSRVYEVPKGWVHDRRGT